MVGPGGPTALVGRDDLLADLLAAAEGAARGAGSLVVLTGDAGMGKTSVARALAEQVAGGLAVSWGACLADGSAPPFWPWRALLGPARSTTVEGDGPGEAAGVARFELLGGLRDELVDRARQQPFLHVIEDLQWADVASVLLLGQLAHVVAGAPLMVVATIRSGEALPRPLEDAVEQVRRAAVVWPLAPLPRDDTERLVRGAGLEPAGELAELISERTGGNPLFVSELLRMVRATARGGSPAATLAAGVPDRVTELVVHRVERLPTAVHEQVMTAAVIGAEGAVATLAAAAGASATSTLELLQQAAAARLIELVAHGRWRFTHDLVRDAVYAGVPPTVRAQRHAAVLAVLETDPTIPPSVLAHHGLAALPVVDADRAVTLAAQAGEWAFAHRAYEEAVEWFERALAAAPADAAAPWRAQLLVQGGEAHRHVGGIEAARACFLGAAEHADDPALLAAAALGYADPGADLGIAYRAEDAATGMLLERAIAAQPTPDSVTTVLLEARLAAELYFSDQPERAGDLARSAIARAERLGEGRALGAAHAVHHDAFVVGQAPTADQLAGSARLLSWARADGSTAGLLTAHRARVFDLLADGDLAGMEAEALAFRRLAEPLRVPGYLWWPALWSAMRALLEGRHAEAEASALEAYAIGEGPSPALALANLSFLLFFLRREQGRGAEMEQGARDYAARQPDIPALRVGLLFLLAELGRLDEAAGMLTGIDDSALRRLRDRNWPASWFQLARAALLVGDRDVAARLLDPATGPSERCVLVSLGTVCLGATALGRAWSFQTIGDHDAADAHYREAEAVNARIGARSWLAQARADHARLLLDRDQAGDRDEATALCQLAAEAAQEIGLRSAEGALDEVRRRLAASLPDVVGGAAPGPAVADGSRFRRSGDVWELAWAGRTAQVRHSRGLADLAQLLARPGEAVSVLDLLDDPDAPVAAVRGAPALDERARREIRARLHALDDAIADAESDGDGVRAGLLREELQQLAEAVARDTGLGGRSRRIGDPVERARKTVSTRIRRAITQVGRAHPDLGRHLERSVDTGTWCAYRPAEPVRWTT